jgi:hypothetical protein
MNCTFLNLPLRLMRSHRGMMLTLISMTFPVLLSHYSTNPSPSRVNSLKLQSLLGSLILLIGDQHPLAQRLGLVVSRLLVVQLHEAVCGSAGV